MHTQPDPSNYSGFQISPPKFVAAPSTAHDLVEHMNPLRCNKCLEQREVTLKSFKQAYVPFFVYLTMLFGVLIGLLVLLAARVQHQITLPFCDRCWRKSRNADWLSGLSLAAFLLSLIAGLIVMLKLNSGLGFLLPTVPAVAFLVWAIMNKRKNNPTIKKIDRTHVVVSTASGEIVFAK